MSQTQANLFAPPSDSVGNAVIWNPSRAVYESFRLAHIGLSVVAAYILLIPFRLGSIEHLPEKAGAIAIVAIILVGTGCILLRELRAYWSEDATKERNVIRVHAASSLFAPLISVLMLHGSRGSSSVFLVGIVALGAIWHISVVFRESMLRQRLQFAVAHSGDSTCTSLHIAGYSSAETTATWETSGESNAIPVLTPIERREVFVAWLRNQLFSKRGFALISTATALLLGAVLLASYLIPVEVARYEIGIDGENLLGTIETKRGGFWLTCIDRQYSGQSPNFFMQTRTSSVRSNLSVSDSSGKPTIHFDINRYVFIYYAGNTVLADFDCKTHQFRLR